MTFALCPDNGPPRLWRFVAPGQLGYTDWGRPIVSVLMKKDNILLLDKELLDGLPELTRHMVLRTQLAFETV